MIVSPKVDVLNPTEPKGDLTITIENRDDGLVFVECNVKFVLDIFRTNGGGRQNQQQAWAFLQGLFHCRIPPLTPSDVLVKPHVCAGCLQITGKPQRELGIVAGIAEEN